MKKLYINVELMPQGRSLAKAQELLDQENAKSSNKDLHRDDMDNVVIGGNGCDFYVFGIDEHNSQVYPDQNDFDNHFQNSDVFEAYGTDTYRDFIDYAQNNMSEIAYDIIENEKADHEMGGK